MFDHDETIPEWMVDALRRPVGTSPARRARIMALVRAHATRHHAGGRTVWRARRGLTTPVIGLTLAAGIGGIVAAVGLFDPPRYTRGPDAAAAHVQVIGDTTGATLRDSQWVRAPAIMDQGDMRRHRTPVAIVGGDST
jgi:hypothetical protein